MTLSAWVTINRWKSLSSFSLTYSKKDKMSEVGSWPLVKGWTLEVIWRSSVQAGTPKADCPGPCTDAFKVLQDPKYFLSNLCSLTCTVQRCFLMFRGNFLSVSLCLLPPVLAMHANEESDSVLIALSVLTVDIDEITPESIFKLNSPNSLSLSL